MAKATRSPILGFNHNVRYHGRVYHVQTEDSGISHNRVFTHLFFEGSIIASKRYDYPEDVSEDQVKGLMQTQHKAILKELKLGVYDPKILSFFAPRGLDGFLDVAAAMPLPYPQTPSDHADGGPEPGQESAYGEMEVGPTPADAAPTAAPAQGSWQLAPEVAALATLPALDLDALPPIESDEGPMPDVIVDAAPNAQGLGVYSMRAQPRERPFDSPTPAPTPAPVVRLPTPIPPARAPVVVIRPPIARRPIPKPAYSSPPPGGVIVQRTVVIGVGGVGQDGLRARRPRPAVPYVVKEGSHPIVQNPLGAQVAPPVPSTPLPPATISDKSLDEVILAYLSQDNDNKR